MTRPVFPRFVKDSSNYFKMARYYASIYANDWYINRSSRQNILTLFWDCPLAIEMTWPYVYFQCLPSMYIQWATISIEYNLAKTLISAFHSVWQQVHYIKSLIALTFIQKLPPVYLRGFYLLSHIEGNKEEDYCDGSWEASLECPLQVVSVSVYIQSPLMEIGSGSKSFPLRLKQ